MGLTDAFKRQDSLVSAYQKVFDTEDGKVVLLDLMRTHWMLSSTYVKEPTDMSFREGERNVVLRICSLLKLDVAKLRERMREYEELDK